MASCPTGSGYDPSGAVETFHNIPHTDIDLQDSPDAFDPSSREYWEAVIIWACLPILVCVCTLILMSIYFICVCCCCCCGGSRDWSKKPKIGCGILNLSIIAVLLALTGASLWAELSIDESIHDALDTASTVDDFFNQYGNNSDLYNEAMQNMYLNTLEQALQEQTPQPAEEIEDVSNLRSANDMIGTVFSDIDAAVGPFDLDQVIDRAEEAVEGFRNWVVIAYLCVVLVVLVLLVTAILCGICVSNPVFLIIMVVVLVILTVTMWIAAGGNLALLIIVGDICDDPDTLLRNFTQEQSNPVDPNIISYYLVCNTTCEPNPFNQPITDANTAFAIINVLEHDLMDYTSNSTNSSILQPLLNDVVNGFNGSRIGVDEITSCQFIHEAYLDLLQTLCGDAYESFVVLFGLVCGLCVGMMVLVVTATFHTGFYCNNRKAYDEEAEAFEFPATTTGGGVWSAYGTNMNYNSSYNQYREHGQPTAATPSGGVTQPPKYNDLQRPGIGNQSSTGGATSGPVHYNEMHEISNTHRPPSGSYDNT